MSLEDFDWSNLPPSPYSDDAWFRMLIPGEIATLIGVLDAVGKWRDLAAKEYAEFCDGIQKRWNPAWDDFGYDPTDNEIHLLLNVERSMFGTLGVSIASTAENLITGICKERNIPLANADGDIDFGTISQNFGNAIGVELHTLPGYVGNQRARMLGNCYKHNSGKTDVRFAAKYKVPVDEKIEFESENWPAMISETKTLLHEIADRLKAKPPASDAES